jgi:hypothetical protein
LGDRVPVYPLLVALCGLNPGVIWVAQSILGIASSLMLFDMAFRRTRHGLFSFLVGLICGLIPEVVIFEAGIMTESLTNFLLVASLWFIARCDGAEEGNIRYPLALGTIVALAGLTRPLMMCLVPVYFCFLVPLWPPTQTLRPENIKKTFYYSLPVIVLILGWCGFNYFDHGYFTPTIRAGQQLMDQVDPYVELAPDRFAVLRDDWLKSRGQFSQDEDYPDSYLRKMERLTGKTEAQLCHEYAALALYLEIHHPLLCFRRTEQGWMQFWGEPNGSEIEWPRDGKFRLKESVNAMDYFLIREIKATFLILALVSIPCALFRPMAFTKLEYLISAIALWISIVAAFTEFGDNRRFCLPLYMAIFYSVLVRGWTWITAIPSKRHGPTLG